MLQPRQLAGVPLVRGLVEGANVLGDPKNEGRVEAVVVPRQGRVLVLHDFHQRAEERGLAVKLGRRGVHDSRPVQKPEQEVDAAEADEVLDDDVVAARLADAVAALQADAVVV